MMHTPLKSDAGFTLAEMAIVLFIVVLLLGGLLVPLSAQIESHNIQATRDTLSEINEALLGFAAAQGRLPCPAQDGATGVESPLGGGACTNPYDGLLPAVTLGISPTDSAGYAVDAWGNRIRYVVSRDPTSGTVASNHNSPSRWSFTTAYGMHALVTSVGCTAGISCLHPDLHVCSAGGATAQEVCANTTSTLGDGAVAVVYSLGNNAATGGTDSDESNNPNPNTSVAADRVFISHEPTAAGSTSGEFDDIVTWLSPNILYNRMIAARRLP